VINDISISIPRDRLVLDMTGGELLPEAQP
jgi:hypothetical protein